MTCVQFLEGGLVTYSNEKKVYTKTKQGNGDFDENEKRNNLLWVHTRHKSIKTYLCLCDFVLQKGGGILIKKSRKQQVDLKVHSFCSLFICLAHLWQHFSHTYVCRHMYQTSHLLTCSCQTVRRHRSVQRAGWDREGGGRSEKTSCSGSFSASMYN